MLKPKTLYDVYHDSIPIEEFAQYPDEFVTRPPYQRKNVWPREKKQALLDSLFRRFYIPRIVIREVRISEHHILKEVIDGQQRIETVRDFLANRLPLPASLKDFYPSLPGKRFSELDAEWRRYVNRTLVYEADIIKGIEDPRNPEHQKIATEIFWRLQQGESLTFMEVAHARLSSLHRNFVAKYADDISFDYKNCTPVDQNPHKHPFFTIIDRPNDRLQHLALLARMVLLERHDGFGNVNDTAVIHFIDEGLVPDGIGNDSYENTPVAKAVLRTLNVFYDIFKDDTLVKGGVGKSRNSRPNISFSHFSCYFVIY